MIAFFLPLDLYLSHLLSPDLNLVSSALLILQQWQGYVTFLAAPPFIRQDQWLFKSWGLTTFNFFIARPFHIQVNHFCQHHNKNQKTLSQVELRQTVKLLEVGQIVHRRGRRRQWRHRRGQQVPLGARRLDKAPPAFNLLQLMGPLGPAAPLMEPLGLLAPLLQRFRHHPLTWWLKVQAFFHT